MQIFDRDLFMVVGGPSSCLHCLFRIFLILFLLKLARHLLNFELFRIGKFALCSVQFLSKFVDNLREPFSNIYKLKVTIILI